MENLWTARAFTSHYGGVPHPAAKMVLVTASSREEAEEKALAFYAEMREKGLETYPDPVRDRYRIGQFVTGPYSDPNGFQVVA
jgi:hypothetical protein